MTKRRVVDRGKPDVGKRLEGAFMHQGSCTTTDLAFCPGSKLAFVPILEPGQGFRDKSLSDKSLSRLLSRVEEPEQKVPDVKKKISHYGIRSQDLLLNAWFPCQFT